MHREEFVKEINKQLKLIRTEYGLTQDKMAMVLGVSKKTLVESEKGRRTLGWTEVVTLVSIFSQSKILQNAFGGEVSDIVQALAFEDIEIKYPDTMGGKIWWNLIDEKRGIKLQQNIVSQHYRILNEYDQRMLSTFDEDEAREYFAQL